MKKAEKQKKRFLKSDKKSSMNLLAFSMTCFINIAIAVYSMSSIHDWLTDTGIEFIVGDIFSFPAYIALAFGLLTVLAICAVLFYAPKLLPPIYLISLAGATGCVFLGVQIVMQPSTFLTGYSNAWKFYLNTAKTGYVQDRLGCCGYSRPREFEGDNCNVSVTTPCMKKIIGEFSGSMQIGGLLLVIHGLSFGILLYYAIMAPCPSVILLPPMDQGNPMLMNQGGQQGYNPPLVGQQPLPPNPMFSNPTIPQNRIFTNQSIPQQQQTIYGMNQQRPPMYINNGQIPQQQVQQIRQIPTNVIAFNQQIPQIPQQVQQQIGIPINQMQIQPQQLGINMQQPQQIGINPQQLQQLGINIQQPQQQQQIQQTVQQIGINKQQQPIQQSVNNQSQQQQIGISQPQPQQQSLVSTNQNVSQQSLSSPQQQVQQQTANLLSITSGSPQQSITSDMTTPTV